MKTDYIKPEIEICNIEPTTFIAASLESSGTYDDIDGNGMTTGSNNRRGSWGDFWD